MVRRYRRKYNNKGNSLLTNKNMRRVLKKTNNISKVEEFRHIFFLDNFDVIPSGNIFSLTSLGQGDDIGDRHGRKIYATKIEMKGFMRYRSITVAQQNCRILIVKDSEQNGILPVISSTIDSASGILEVANINSFLSLQLASKRYTVLFDKRFAFASGSVNGLANPSNQMFSFSKRISFPIYYNGVSGLIENQGKNNIYILFFANETGGALMETQITFRTRIQYQEV